MKGKCSSYLEFYQEKKTQINVNIEVYKNITKEEGKQKLEDTNTDKNNSKRRQHNF